MSKLSKSKLQQRLNSISELAGLNFELQVDCLIDFYELRRLDLLLRKINELHLRDLSIVEINQLSVLYTVIQNLAIKLRLNG